MSLSRPVFTLGEENEDAASVLAGQDDVRLKRVHNLDSILCDSLGAVAVNRNLRSFASAAAVIDATNESVQLELAASFFFPPLRALQRVGFFLLVRYGAALWPPVRR